MIAAFALLAILATEFGGVSDPITVAGVAGSQLFNTLTSYIMTTSANTEQVRCVTFLLRGNPSGIRRRTPGNSGSEMHEATIGSSKQIFA